MYIDFVVCRHLVDPKRYLYIAPAWSYLDEDDEVVVDIDGEEKHAVVIDSKTVEVNSDWYNFVLNVAGAQIPMHKIIKKLVYRDLIYKEENE